MGRPSLLNSVDKPKSSTFKRIADQETKQYKFKLKERVEETKKKKKRNDSVDEEYVDDSEGEIENLTQKVPATPNSKGFFSSLVNFFS